MNIVPVTGRPPVNPCVSELNELYHGPSLHRCSTRCYDGTVATLKSSVLNIVKKMPKSQCELLRHHLELGNLPAKYIHVTRYALERITSVVNATLLIKKYLIKRVMSCKSDEERFDLLCLIPDSTKGKGTIAEQTYPNAKQSFARLKIGYSNKEEFVRVLRIALMYVSRSYCSQAIAANKDLFTASNLERQIVADFANRVFARRCEALSKVALTIRKKDFLNLPIEEQVPQQRKINKYRWKSNVISGPNDRIRLRLIREIVDVPLTERSRPRVRHHIHEQHRILLSNLGKGSTDLSDLNRTILKVRTLANKRLFRSYICKYVNIQLSKGTNPYAILCNLPSKTRCSKSIIKALSKRDFQISNKFKKLQTPIIDFCWVIPILFKYFGIRWINRHLLQYKRVICKSQHDIFALKKLCTKLRTLILSGYAERNSLQTTNISDIVSTHDSESDDDNVSNVGEQAFITSPQSTIEEDDPLPGTSSQEGIKSELNIIQYKEETEPLPCTSSQEGIKSELNIIQYKEETEPLPCTSSQEDIKSELNIIQYKEETEPLPCTSSQEDIKSELNIIQYKEETEPLSGTSSQTEHANEAKDSTVIRSLQFETQNQAVLSGFMNIHPDQLELLCITIDNMVGTHNN